MTFGEALDVLLQKGVRPPDDPRVGRKWTYGQFGAALGFADLEGRQIRRYRAHKSLPRDTVNIEKTLFGDDPAHYSEWRQHLRVTLEAARRQVGKRIELLSGEIGISFGQPKHYVPVRVPRHFQSREREISELQAALRIPPHRVALVGPPGVGKTIAASAFADRAKIFYRLVFWINASNHAALAESMMALGTLLGDKSSETSATHSAAAVLDKVRSQGQGVLLIYDNALDPASLHEWLPGGDKTDIIITSNAEFWSAEAHPISIEPWSLEVSTAFLMSRMSQKPSQLEASELVQEIGGVPLALELAAAYCERRYITLSNYRQQLLNNPSEHLRNSQHLVPSYQRSLLASITTAIHAATEHVPQAQRILSALSYLAPDPIPVSLWASPQVAGTASELSPRVVVEACGVLRSFSLLTASSQGPSAQDDIVIHPLVRLTARSISAAASIDDAVQLLLQIYPDANNDDELGLRTYLRLTPHMSELRRSLGAQPVNAEVATLYLRHARYLIDDAKARRAWRFVAAARRSYKVLYGESSAEYASALAVFGRLLLVQNHLKVAQRCLRKAQAIFESLFGKTDHRTLKALTDAAVTHLLEGHLAAVIAGYNILSYVLEEQTKLYPEGHRRIVEALCDMYPVAFELGYYQDAFDHAWTALEIAETVLPAQHPLFAKVYRGMGLKAYHNMSIEGDEGCIAWHRKALDVMKLHYQLPHPAVANVALELVEWQVMHLEGDAWLVWEETMNDAIEASEGSPFHVAECHRIIATALHFAGQDSEAMQYGEAALAIHGKENRKKTALILAEIYETSGDVAKADQLMREYGE